MRLQEACSRSHLRAGRPGTRYLEWVTPLHPRRRSNRLPLNCPCPKRRSWRSASTWCWWVHTGIITHPYNTSKQRSCTPAAVLWYRLGYIWRSTWLRPRKKKKQTTSNLSVVTEITKNIYGPWLFCAENHSFQLNALCTWCQPFPICSHNLYLHNYLKDKYFIYPWRK